MFLGAPALCKLRSTCRVVQSLDVMFCQLALKRRECHEHQNAPINQKFRRTFVKSNWRRTDFLLLITWPFHHYYISLARKTWSIYSELPAGNPGLNLIKILLLDKVY